MSPFGAGTYEAGRIYRRVKMLMANPFPSYVPFGIDFLDGITPHNSFSLGSGITALNFSRDIFGYLYPFEHQSIA